MKKIKVGIVGLGRMGIFHATSLIKLSTMCELTSICVYGGENDRIAIDELSKIANTGFKIYYNYQTMIEKADIDAVVIVSSTKFHPEHIALAIQHNKFVFCEKPIGINPADGESLLAICDQYPDAFLQMGYMRRYDASYQEAKKRIDDGEIGIPYLVRAYGQDGIQDIQKAIAFGPNSGGEFVDMGVHEINLIRWFLQAEPESVWAIGDCYAYPEFKNWKDGDNVSCLMQMQPNQNGQQAMAFLVLGRTANHGYNVETEILGTKGTIKIGSTTNKNYLEILNQSGTVVEWPKNFVERFHAAYFEELSVFIKTAIAIQQQDYHNYPKLKYVIQDAINDLIVAYKCKESFEKNILVKIKD